jgi:hypothetical protein
MNYAQRRRGAVISTLKISAKLTKYGQTFSARSDEIDAGTF